MDKSALVKNGFSEFRKYLDKMEEEIYNKLKDMEVGCPLGIRLKIDVTYSEVTNVDDDFRFYRFLNKPVITYTEDRY